MAKRIICANEGDTFEFRFVGKGQERSFRVWDRLARPSRMLLRVWYCRVAPADPQVQFDTTNEAWK